MSEPRIFSYETCPRCDRAFDARMSGVVAAGSPATIDLDGYDDLCLHTHEGEGVLFFHPAEGGDDDG